MAEGGVGGSGSRKELYERMEKDEKARRNVKTNLMITLCVNHFSFVFLYKRTRWGALFVVAEL